MIVVSAMPEIDRLRVHAVTHSLFPPTTLKAAIERLGFVQADPIRSPARAQDLILRHRVNGYRAGDLERSYAALGIEEDLLYAYGFLPRGVWELLHPRPAARLTDFEKKVLRLVQRAGPMHPGELEPLCGGGRVINAWGGYSKATKHALERLHYLGLLRIARREKGVRVYEAKSRRRGAMPAHDRLEKLILAIANVLAPVSENTLQAIAARLRRSLAGKGDYRKALRELFGSGRLEKQPVDNVTYIWPASAAVRKPHPRKVRFLAPFDPLVWDRRRFEHLWQWPYRFEAYTPPANRVRGYYAMPLLWSDRVVGWANASVAAGKLHVECGFVGKRPASRDFAVELEAEIARLDAFLAKPNS